MDGNEAVYSLNVACSAPLTAYQCGGEERNYGDFTGSVSKANSAAKGAICPQVGGCK